MKNYPLSYSIHKWISMELYSSHSNLLVLLALKDLLVPIFPTGLLVLMDLQVPEVRKVLQVPLDHMDLLDLMVHILLVLHTVLMVRMVLVVLVLHNPP